MAQPNSPRPERPTPALVRQFIQRFDDGRAGLLDKSLATLFRSFPDNRQYEHVLFKVLGLNSLHNTNVIAVAPVVRHILSLDVDAMLAEGAPELVNQIARTPIRDGKTRRFYSFSSKYCSWHAPDAYPIYDSIVDRLLWAYQQADKFTDAFWRTALGDYPTFKRIVEAFQAHYGLTEFSFRNLDKFLWLYGKAYLGKTAAVPSPQAAEE